jgi:hypothetical protein
MNTKMDPDDRIAMWLFGSAIGIGVVAAIAIIGWLLYSHIIARQDQSACRQRGGNVERKEALSDDWSCVGTTPERP